MPLCYWSANRYIILERLIAASVLDDVWDAYECVGRGGTIHLPPKPAGEGDPYADTGHSISSKHFACYDRRP